MGVRYYHAHLHSAHTVWCITITHNAYGKTIKLFDWKNSFSKSDIKLCVLVIVYTSPDRENVLLCIRPRGRSITKDNKNHVSPEYREFVTSQNNPCE